MATRRPPPNQLNPQQVASLIDQVQQYLGLVDRAEACGLDCQAHRMVAQNAGAQLERIKRFILDGEKPTQAEVQSGRDLTFMTQPPLPNE